MNNKVAIFGDVHGCYEPLVELLNHPQLQDMPVYSVGDITEKGPESNKCLELCFDKGVILANSNHDEKYIKLIKQNRAPESIKNEYRRKIYEYLSQKSKDYLLTAKPFITPANSGVTIVHGGIGPKHNLYPLDAKSYNEILRLRFIDKNTLEHVGIIQDTDGTYRPEHSNIWKWQEVYDGRYGCIIHGHIVDGEQPIAWLIDGNKCCPKFINTKLAKVISLDTGCVYGGFLSAAIIDISTGNIEFIQVKAKAAYAKAHVN